MQALPEDDLPFPLPSAGDGRWHESFCQAAREYLTKLKENELLILGLRSYNLSQREVAALLQVHEGTVSRRTDQLREQCLDSLPNGCWSRAGPATTCRITCVRKCSVSCSTNPRLSVDYLAHLLAQKGLQPPLGEG